MTDEQNKLTYYACGPPSETCQCACPDSCGHRWDGEFYEEHPPEGGGFGTVTCSKCGMHAIEHDMWVAP